MDTQSSREYFDGSISQKLGRSELSHALATKHQRVNTLISLAVFFVSALLISSVIISYQQSYSQVRHWQYVQSTHYYPVNNN